MLNSKERILVISQWPKIKNAEYQLIEAMKEVSLVVTVVDPFGVDISTGEDLNSGNLYDQFKFAIALHFDTPKLLNIKTYYWVANPLEYLYLKPEYGHVTIDNIRSFDDYLFNGSTILKQQVKNLLGEEFIDNGNYFYPSAALQKIYPPKNVDAKHRGKTTGKVFYCGINWERIISKDSRSQGLLSELECQGIIDIFGPAIASGVKVWDGFSSYKGEIPFDNSSLARTMQRYQAVLCMSSPAHIRSKTSSSRVFEAFAAGVPVISDKNEHVEKLFGSLVYYYDGVTDQEKSESIAYCLQQISRNKKDTQARVKKAQELIRDKYSFDVCLKRLVSNNESSQASRMASSQKRLSTQFILYHHDPTGQVKLEGVSFNNIRHCLSAFRKQVGCNEKKFLTVICARRSIFIEKGLLEIAKDSGVEVEVLYPDVIGLPCWDKEKLGTKIASMINYIKADAVSFINSYEYPHHDYFDKYHAFGNKEELIYISGGFYCWPSRGRRWSRSKDDSLGRSPDHRFNQSEASYIWSRASIGNNHLGRIIFPRSFLTDNLSRKLLFFDIMLPCVILILAKESGYKTHRSRFITLVMERNILIEYSQHVAQVTKDHGFWGRHYFLIANADHETNAGFDLFSSCEALKIWRAVAHVTETQAVQSISRDEQETLRYLSKSFLPILRFYHEMKLRLSRMFSFTSA